MIHDAELFTVGCDEAVVTFRTDDDTTVATVVGDHEISTSGTLHAARITGLEPATEYALQLDGVDANELLPATLTTLPRPAGRRLATFATVNDVHFGEFECGKLGTPEELGPVFTTEPGETPYYEVMNRGAISEIEALDPDAVVVKGDLTNLGEDWEYELFCNAYSRLGERMRHVRGNHDAMISAQIAATGPFVIELDGVTLAVLDTVVPGHENGRVSPEQLSWLDDVSASATKTVLVFGHHHPWDPSSHERNAHYFGINPDDSEKLCALINHRESIAGYFAGHTHRTRKRNFAQARDIPIVEIACVKDYPGAWAEYQVYEGGYVQLTRRISTPDALDWTEKTRNMFAGLYRDYALGGLADRCFTHSL